MSAQIVNHNHVAELRWDGASELIGVEGPDRATMNEWEHDSIESSQFESLGFDGKKVDTNDI